MVDKAETARKAAGGKGKKENRAGKLVAMPGLKLDEFIGINNRPIPGARSIPVKEIGSNPMEPRSPVTDEEIEELSISIESVGLINPIRIRPADDKMKKKGKPYQVVAGGRRLRAAEKCGMKELPCIVSEHTPEEAEAISLVENLQRLDLSVREKVRAVERIYSSREKAGRKRVETQEEIGRMLGLTDRTVRIYLKIAGGLTDEEISELEGEGRSLTEILERANNGKEREKKRRKPCMTHKRALGKLNSCLNYIEAVAEAVKDKEIIPLSDPEEIKKACQEIISRAKELFEMC